MEQNQVCIILYRWGLQGNGSTFLTPKTQNKKNLRNLFESYWVPLVHRAYLAATHTTNPKAQHEQVWDAISTWVEVAAHT